MTGLSVLYGNGVTYDGEREQSERTRAKRLRELYWARRAEGKTRRKSLLRMEMNLPVDRSEIGRGPTDPGDGLRYRVRLFPRREGHFDWVEVTEVFTTFSAKDVEGVMRGLHGIQGKHVVDATEFLRTIRRTRPSRREQRRAADEVIARVRDKLTKSSYQKLVERYGYGTLVVGIPLWFAVLPDDPYRPANVLDDFFSRTSVGLLEVKRSLLRKPTCPFRRVIVTWDTTPEAMDEWRRRRSPCYDDVANTRLGHPLPPSFLGVLSSLVSKAGLPDIETAPSLGFHASVDVEKKRSGIGPYPDSVRAIGQHFLERENQEDKLGERVRRSIGLTLCKLLWFKRLHGMRGLRAWAARRVSVPHAWRVRAIRLQARRLYRESEKRRIQRSRMRRGS